MEGGREGGERRGEGGERKGRGRKGRGRGEVVVYLCLSDVMVHQATFDIHLE